MKKRFIIRITFFVILILLGISLYTIGKEHKVLIDNKDISINKTIYVADNPYKIWIDGKEIGSIKKNERKVAKVSGKNHKIIIEKIKDKVSTGEKIEKKFNLKTNESATINIPAMMNNVEQWINKIKN